MGVFGEKQIAKAIERLPTLASAEIRTQMERARLNNLTEFLKACETELARRPIEFSAQQAARVKQTAEVAYDMELREAVLYAFGHVQPPSAEEARFLRWIAANPGATYREAEAEHGKGDLGLVIGHLVYERFGCFRHLVEKGEDQSSVLLNKDRSGPSVRYRLRADVRNALQELRIIEE